MKEYILIFQDHLVRHGAEDATEEAFEADMLLNMGQLLSIPFIIIGVSCMIGGKWMEKLGAKR